MSRHFSQKRYVNTNHHQLYEKCLASLIREKYVKITMRYHFHVSEYQDDYYKKWKQWDFIFLGSKISAAGNCNHEIKRHLLMRKICDKPRQHIKKQRHYFAKKGLYSQSYSFSSSHIWMWELGHKEGWMLKNWCFWTVVLEKTLESPLDCKEIQPVHPKKFNPKYSLEGLMLKLQYFGHLIWRASSLEKTLMLRKTEGRRRSG